MTLLTIVSGRVSGEIPSGSQGMISRLHSNRCNDVFVLNSFGCSVSTAETFLGRSAGWYAYEQQKQIVTYDDLIDIHLSSRLSVSLVYRNIASRTIPHIQNETVRLSVQLINRFVCRIVYRNSWWGWRINRQTSAVSCMTATVCCNRPHSRTMNDQLLTASSRCLATAGRSCDWRRWTDRPGSHDDQLDPFTFIIHQY